MTKQDAPTTTDGRAEFEADYFGNLPMTSEARSRNGDGYSFSLPQTAWMTWQRAWQAARASSAAAQWISVDDEMPEPGQTVAFVVRTDPDGSHRHLNGRVLGGRYLLGQGFSVPGLSVDASHWHPLTAPPAKPADTGEAPPLPAEGA